MLLMCRGWAAGAEEDIVPQGAPAAQRRQPPARSDAGAAKQSPGEAESRWQKGLVCIDGKWLTRQQAAEAARQDKRLAEYRKLRERSAQTVPDQAALARWCKKNKLPDEERVHWLSVAQLQPDNAEAIKGLGLHPYQGMLLTNAEIAQRKSEAQTFQKAMERWRGLVAKWARAVENHDAADAGEILAEVRKISASAEMLTLERVIWQQLGSKKEKKRTYEALSVALVSTLKQMPLQAAVESLTRHAVFSPLPAVRGAAIAALKERRLDRYLPLLVSGMAMPIEASTSGSFTMPDATGCSCYFYQLSQEGPLMDVSIALGT
jgi:hypothetical protein